MINDIRSVNRCEWAGPIFRTLPIGLLQISCVFESRKKHFPCSLYRRNAQMLLRSMNIPHRRTDGYTVQIWNAGCKNFPAFRPARSEATISCVPQKLRPKRKSIRFQIISGLRKYPDLKRDIPCERWLPFALYAPRIP